MISSRVNCFYNQVFKLCTYENLPISYTCQKVKENSQVSMRQEAHRDTYAYTMGT